MKNSNDAALPDPCRTMFFIALGQMRSTASQGVAALLGPLKKITDFLQNSVLHALGQMRSTASQGVAALLGPRS